MPTCSFLKRRKRKICIGDLDTLITLYNRDVVAPEFGAVDFDVAFNQSNNVWAMVSTNTGKTLFDGVDRDVNITHTIAIRHDASVTAETSVELNGKKLKIIHVEDFEERGEFMLLECRYRGVGEAAKA